MPGAFYLRYLSSRSNNPRTICFPFRCYGYGHTRSWEQHPFRKFDFTNFVKDCICPMCICLVIFSSLREPAPLSSGDAFPAEVNNVAYLKLAVILFDVPISFKTNPRNVVMSLATGSAVCKNRIWVCFVDHEIAPCEVFFTT